MNNKELQNFAEQLEAIANEPIMDIEKLRPVIQQLVEYLAFAKIKE